MKNLLFILIIGFLFISQDASFAQSGWTYFKYKDVLIKGYAISIQSDYNGGVFLGMNCGLAKFNGDEWVKVYYNELIPNDANNKYNIRSIKSMGSQIWTGTNEGLIKFDGYNRKHYNLSNTPSMLNDKIRGFAGDKYGNVWFFNNRLGIFKLDKTSDTVVTYTMSQNDPFPVNNDAKMFCDADDNLWYSAYGKFVKFKDGIVKVIDSTEIPLFINDTLSSIQIMQDNSIVVLMKHSIGLYKDYNGVITFNKIDVPQNLLNNDEYFHSVKIDMERNIWIITKSTTSSRHFYKYSNKKEWTKYEFPTYDSLPTNYYNLVDFTIDENGKVWFADPSYGIFVFDPKITSVYDNTENVSFQISPNPVSDFLCINSNIELGKIKIYSALGLKVLDTEWKERIDVSGLVPGVYFVRVGDKVSKFIKI